MEQPELTQEERHRYHSFFYFWFGQQISLLGSSVVQFVLTWWITVVTENPAYLSLGLFLTFLPRIFLGPIAGVLADKFNKKVLLVVTDGLQALTTLALMITLMMGDLNIWLVLGFNTLRSVFQSIQGPVSSTITPLMVPKPKLQRMNSFSQLFRTLIDIGATVLGALLYGFMDIKNILWIDIITFGIAISLLFQVKIPSLKKDAKQQPLSELQQEITSDVSEKPVKPSVWAQFAEGIKAIKNIKGLTPLLTLMVLANFLLSPFNTLITYFVTDTHNGDQWDMVLLTVMINVGMVVGSIIPSLKSNWKQKTLIIFTSIFFVYLGILFFSLAPEGDFLWLSITSFIITFLLPIAMTINITILQTAIPIQKMGRVIAFFMAVNSLFMLIGYLISGPLANWIGIVPLYIVASISGMILTVLLYIFTSVRNLDKVGTESKAESIKKSSTEMSNETMTNSEIDEIETSCL